VTVIVAYGLLMVVGLGFIYSGVYDIGADSPHWRLVSHGLETARIRSIRSHAAGITAPSGLEDPARIVAGVSHYAEHCAVCHGAPGVERSDLADGLYPRPPNLAETARSYTPSELFWIVKHGIKMTGMPSGGDHSDDELWATVAFIEKLPGMTEEEYGKLLVAGRAQGGHQHDNQQPAAEITQPAEKDHDHPAAPEEMQQQPGAARHDHPAGKAHDHATGHHRH
jgi:mono/diheme cytochrome c family protein